MRLAMGAWEAPCRFFGLGEPPKEVRGRLLIAQGCGVSSTITDHPSLA